MVGWRRSKDAGQEGTCKKRTVLDILFVRTWLRREVKLISDEELEVFKSWETALIRRVTFYDGPAEPAAGPTPV